MEYNLKAKHLMSINMWQRSECGCALSKLLQIGTVAELESAFVILANRVTGIFANLLKSFYISGLKLELQREVFRSRPTTLGEAFSFVRIVEAHFEDKRSTIAIAKPNELTANVHVQDLEQTTRERGDEPNPIQLVMIDYMIYPITVEVLNKIFSPQGGVDESETLGPKTPVKEVVDNGNGSALIFLVGYDTRSKVMTGLSEEFQEEDMVDALSRVLEQTRSYQLALLLRYDTESKVVTGLLEEFQEEDTVDALSRVLEQTSLEKWVDSGSRRRETTHFLEPHYSLSSILVLVILLVEEYGIP
uniref:Retrotransposon-related protein n=1 Tax=Tanacetum cinerariifolium TaxID=118510 RepID=A0A699H8Q0_TANCI|nr:retrotransposon-related protein [Tanacetum cinerariifolium]